MESIQLSLFDEIEPPAQTWDEEMLEKEIQRGCIDNARSTVKAIAIDSCFSIPAIVDAMKTNYGTGGHSVEKGFIDYNGSGFRLWLWGEERVEKKYTWKQAAQKLIELIVREETI